MELLASDIVEFGVVYIAIASVSVFIAGRLCAVNSKNGE